ncbi:MAG: CAP domain-containing protein [Saccharofermentanales bacterium]
MKFAKWSFFVVCISLALSLLVTGCVQIVGAQAREEVDFLQSSSSNIASLESEISSSVAASIFSGSVSSDSISQESSEIESSSILSSSFNSFIPAIPSVTPGFVSELSPKHVYSVNNSSKLVSSSSKTVVTPYVKPTSPVIPVKTAVKVVPSTAPAAKSVMTAKIDLDKLIGLTLTQVIALYGQPNAKELSEYGFTWFVYNSDYKKFFMVGISDGQVVGVYSNSTYLDFNGLTVGKSRPAVRSALLPGYGRPLTGIQKGNSRYTISNTEQKDVFFDGSSYTTVFYDNIEGGILTSIQIIDKEKELSIGYYGTPSAALAASYERISFYLVNSIRSRKNIAILAWDNKLAGIARLHSADMFKNNYFSHTNLKGLNSSARFRAAGLSYSDCAENIAKNHPSAINAHESFMNSAGHRKNILRACKYIGIGAYVGNNAILLTQDFITYK